MRKIGAAALVALAMAAPAGAQTLDEARAAYLAAWEAAPLAVRKSVLVTGPAAGYGLLEERPTNEFAAGEPVYIYLEPQGYGWKPAGSVNEFGMNIGLRVLTPAAEELFKQDDFLVLTTTSAERPTEFYGNVTLNLTGFPAGEYVLELNLKDIASDESTTVEMPISVK